MHTYVGDLVVSLVAPDGTVYTLRNRTGGSADNIDQTFTVNLSGEARNGTWNLRVQDAASADWLVGEGIFLPGVNGRALRSMSDPGTAYDDPQLGQDPQVGSMADYVETTSDNGGVHLNSGIPNRAFVIAA